MTNNMDTKITVQHIEEARERLKNVVTKTPLHLSKRLSEKYGANIYLKREDLQEVRSFKIRGAYNKMATLTNEEKKLGVVCASAGNHAQGVALSCSLLKVYGVIFMPVGTPLQKIERVKNFGGKYVRIELTGETYDAAGKAAKKYCHDENMVFVHPFNDPLTIAGQGTVGAEIYEAIKPDIVIAAIGGGGLISGVSTYLKAKLPDIKIFGAEPLGAPSMVEALKIGAPIELPKIDTFVDGAAVATAGDLTLQIVKKNVDDIFLVKEGRVCSIMVDLYQNEGIITEPAGALPVAALRKVKDQIKGKNVVCIISGGNNDILRYPEILERSLVWQGKKHYFLIEFAQKPGQLKNFLDKAMGPTDDIVRFEYMKKTSKEKGAALVGIELKDKKDLEPFLEKMRAIELNFKILNPNDLLYQYLI
jgi:threonine dehydratase